MIYITERPEPIVYSRNPLRYRLQVTNPAAAGMEVQVRLYVGNANDALADILVVTLQLTPPASGITDVYVEDIIDSYLEWQMPNPARGTITTVTTQSKSFYIQYRQVSTGLTGTWQTDIADRRIAFKGGFPHKINNRSTPANRPNVSFSYQKDIRVGVDDHFFKSFSLFIDDPILSMVAELKVFYDTGLVVTRTLNFTGPFNKTLYHVPAGLYTWNPSLVSNDVIIYYEVNVLATDAIGTAEHNLITCMVDYNPYDEVVAFNYHTSLGGLDYMRVLGEVDTETERNFIEGEAIITANYNQQVRDWQFFQANITLGTSFKGDAGFFVSPAEQAIAQEIDLNESVWQAVQYAANVWQWIRILITIKSRKLRAISDKKWSFPLEWKYSYQETQFSSLAYTGTGDDTGTYDTLYTLCGLPTNLTSTQGVNGNGSISINMFWTVGGNSIGSEVSYKLSSDSTWTTLEGTGTTTGFFGIAAVTYNWRVRNKCGDGEYSAYVNGGNIVT